MTQYGRRGTLEHLLYKEDDILTGIRRPKKFTMWYGLRVGWGMDTIRLIEQDVQNMNT